MIRALCAVLLLGTIACGRSEPPSATSGTPAATAAGTRLFVSAETAGQVVVVDPASSRVVNRIVVGVRPRGIKASRDGSRLFVALSGSPIGGPGVDESKLPPADRSKDGIGEIDQSDIVKL